MDKLLALIADLDDDEDNGIRFISAAWPHDALELQIEISTFNSPSPITWQVRCANVIAHSLTYTFASAISMQLTSDHPLLWEYTHDHASAFFYGAPVNAHSAVGALYEAHRTVAGDWIPFGQYLNGGVKPSELLKGGHGLLAQGPTFVMALYKEVLSSYGVEVNAGTPYAPLIRKRFPNVRNEIKVLLIGDSYVVGLDWSAQPHS